ncbi:hypothetical protein ADK97_05290 [Streptomyces sp. H021]|nr:hypothetical protein ADK96_36890 [Streptomyces sp. IGB124]KOV44410.1 hypothetical protein ADK97_05290 [Streptomyces sp. H021]
MTHALSATTADVQSFRIATLPDGREVRTIGQFRKLGLTLFYDREERLEGLTVDGLVGPQVLAEGVALTGRTPSEVEKWIVERAETQYADDEFELGYLGTGVPGSWSLGIVVNVQRRDDRLITRPVIFAEHVLDDAHHILPQQAWVIY